MKYRKSIGYKMDYPRIYDKRNIGLYPDLLPVSIPDGCDNDLYMELYEPGWVSNKNSFTPNMYRVVTHTFIKYANKPTPLITMQFDTHTVIKILKPAFDRGDFLDPYYRNLHNNMCAIGNIKYDDNCYHDYTFLMDEYHMWNEYMSRCFNPDNPLFKAFGAFGARPADSRWMIFEFFHQFNAEVMSRGLMPAMDANDPAIYVYPFPIYKMEKKKFNRLPIPSVSDMFKYHITDEMEGFGFDGRYKDGAMHLGRPKGAQNKPKEKVQMYRVIDPSKG